MPRFIPALLAMATLSATAAVSAQTAYPNGQAQSYQYQTAPPPPDGYNGTTIYNGQQQAYAQAPQYAQPQAGYAQPQQETYSYADPNAGGAVQATPEAVPVQPVPQVDSEIQYPAYPAPVAVGYPYPYYYGYPYPYPYVGIGIGFGYGGYYRGPYLRGGYVGGFRPGYGVARVGVGGGFRAAAGGFRGGRR